MQKKSNEVRVAVFSLLFLTSSFLVTNDIIPNAITIFLWVLSLLYVCHRKIYIYPPILIVITILLVSLWISYLVNNDNLLTATKVTFAIVYTAVFVMKYSFEAFSQAFRDVLYFLSIVSIVLFVLYLIIPPLQSLFTVQNLAGRSFSNLVIFVFSSGVNRNYGMFWEPGAFQTFIAIALLLEICNEQRVKRIIVFIIAIVTTLSTTGYLALALLLLLLVTDKRHSLNKKALLLLGVGIVLCIGIYFSSYLITTNSTSVFGKLINFVTKQQYLETYGAANSSTVRFFSVIKPLEAFGESPVVGMCHNNLLQYTNLFTHGMNTCTFVNWFAMYGVLFGTIMILGYLSFAKILSTNLFSFIIIMFLLLTVISTENYADNCMISIFCYYGIQEFLKKHQKRKEQFV